MFLKCLSEFMFKVEYIYNNIYFLESLELCSGIYIYYIKSDGSCLPCNLLCKKVMLKAKTA